MTALLTLDNVSRRFGGLNAVDGVSFSVEKGEIVGLIGPNGAGKTTLINLITGVHPATAGRVFRRPRYYARKPYQIARRGLARTFQIVQPFPKMTVVDNVAAGALFCGHAGSVRGAQDIAREHLAFTGLADVAERSAASLTLARRKRLELAKSLAMRPRLLMLDEVNAGLNQTEVDDALAIIRKIAEQGVTIIVIEHLMKVVLSISHRLVVLHHGQLIAQGAPREVVKDQRVIEAYLGAKYASQAGGGAASATPQKLSVTNLQAGYGDVQVLWDISLEVGAGELVCIIGSNGAGKTTLMRCLSGLLQTSAGSIAINGKAIEHAPPVDFVNAGVAHVPEGRRLFSAMTVRDNLRMGAYFVPTRPPSRRTWTASMRCFPASRRASARTPARCRAANNRCARSGAG